jgi:hypothetical protein
MRPPTNRQRRAQAMTCVTTLRGGGCPAQCWPPLNITCKPVNEVATLLHTGPDLSGFAAHHTNREVRQNTVTDGPSASRLIVISGFAVRHIWAAHSTDVQNYWDTTVNSRWVYCQWHSSVRRESILCFHSWSAQSAGAAAARIPRVQVACGWCGWHLILALAPSLESLVEMNRCSSRHAEC